MRANNLKRIYIYTHHEITLPYTQNQHNIVNQKKLQLKNQSDKNDNLPSTKMDIGLEYLKLKM